jgi:hypothetical protein
MLSFLGRRATHRKRRLFAAACCGRIRHLLRGDWALDCLAAVEEFADGAIGCAELRERRVVAGPAPPTLAHPPTQALAAAAHELRLDPGEVAGLAADSVADTTAAMGAWQSVRAAEQSVQAALARDIFGNPFRTPTFVTDWLTSTVVSLARGIYHERAFDRMPLLMDALMDAGCADEAVLEHCRGPKKHVRGCWVIDLLLAKE